VFQEVMNVITNLVDFSSKLVLMLAQHFIVSILAQTSGI